MLLVGDVGGTKTAVAVYADDVASAVIHEATLPSSAYPSLEALVRAFLESTGLPVERACFGVAGPVTGRTAEITNLPWPTIDADELAAVLGLRNVRLLNDLEAIAWAVPRLGAADLHTLYAGEPVHSGALAVMAPGTGLGAAFLTWDGVRYRPHPSEGGNVDFAPTSARQIELLRYLQQRYDQVRAELVCSGLGIPNIYDFLRDTGAEQEPAWLAEQLAQASDRTPLIVSAAGDAAAPPAICRATMDLFVEILGAEAGNLALTVLATGGVYLGGGIPPRIIPQLADGRLLRAFRRKGPFSDLLARIPVHVIRNPRAALIGAAAAAL